MEKQKTGKNKMMKIVIILGIVLLAGTGLYFLKQAISSRIMDGDGMVNSAAVSSVDYQLSPDEYGRSESIHLSNGHITYYKDDGTEGGNISLSCNTDDAFQNSLEEIIRKYDFASWQNLEKSEIEILDGSTSSMKISFCSGMTIELGDSYEMPEGSWKAVSEICDLLEAYVKEHDSNGSENSEIIPADDSGLKLLVDYCVKTAGTEDADSYKEIVLYENEEDGTYQLHTYAKQGEADAEEHHAYAVSYRLEIKADNLIYDLKLEDYKDQEGTGTEGSEYVVKFRNDDDELIRISTDNMGEDGSEILSQVGSFLYAQIPADAE